MSDNENTHAPVSSELSADERKRLVADEAKELARQQQKELARIRREMRGMDSKKMFVICLLAAVLLVILAVGGYAFWCNFRIRLSKSAFFVEYADTNIEMCKTFVPKDWTQIERLKSDAESASVLLASGEIIKKYEEANKLLVQVKNKALELKEQHKGVKAEYEQAWRETQSKDWPKFAPQLWAKIQEATATVSKDPFDLDEMRKAIVLFKECDKQYPLIVDYAKAREQYQEASKNMDEAEWGGELADELTMIKNKVRMAEDAFHGGFWKNAADAYRAATELVELGSANVGAARNTAEKAVQKFAAAYKEVDMGELQKNAKAAAEQLAQIKAEVDAAWEKNDFPKATEAAGQALALLAKTMERIKQAKETRDTVVAEITKSFEQVRPLRSVLQRNWPEVWERFLKSYQATMELSRTEDYVAFLDGADSVKTLLASLLKSYEEANSSATKIKADFEALRDKVNQSALRLNVAEIWSRAELLWISAERSLEQRQIQRAIDAYTESEALIKAAEKAYVVLKDDCLKQQAEALRREKLFLGGFTRFFPREAAKTQAQLADADGKVNAGNFRDARLLFIEVIKVLPEKQYVPGADDVVYDYVNGLMWARDGRGVGCNGGAKIDWYKAMVWADGVSLGGFKDWQLPTDDQLMLLTELPEAEFKAIFPNTDASLPYWSREHSYKGVDSVIAVDLAGKRKLLVDKKEQRFARLVRAPR